MPNIELTVDGTSDHRSGLLIYCNTDEVLEQRSSGFACKPEIPFLRRDLIAALAEKWVIAGNEYPIDQTRSVFTEGADSEGYEWIGRVPPLKLYLFSPDPTEQKRIVEENPELHLNNYGQLWTPGVKDLRDMYLETTIWADDTTPNTTLHLEDCLFFNPSFSIGEHTYFNNLKLVLGEIKKSLFDLADRPVVSLSGYGSRSEIDVQSVGLVPGNYTDHDWAMRFFLTEFQRLLSADEIKSAVRALSVENWMQSSLVAMKMTYSEEIPQLAKANDTELSGYLAAALEVVNHGMMGKLKEVSKRRLDQATSMVEKDADWCKLLRMMK